MTLARFVDWVMGAQLVLAGLPWIRLRLLDKYQDWLGMARFGGAI
jgi:hypothetical protein